jgi:hypothetical protein
MTYATQPRPVPTVTLHSKLSDRTVWLVKYPDGRKTKGASYFATTYPGSDLLYLESTVRKYAIAPSKAHRMHDEIKAAINQATKQPKEK